MVDKWPLIIQNSSVKRNRLQISWVCVLVLIVLGCGCARKKILPLYSPEKALKIEVEAGVEQGVRFRVSWKGERILEESGFNLDLDGYPEFLRGMTVESVRMAELHEELVPAAGGGVQELSHCFQHTWILRRGKEPRHRIHLIFRAYDHGLAFRFRIPDQPGLESVRILDEAFRFHFNSDPIIWAGEEPGNENPESNPVHGIRLSRLQNQAAAFPLLIQMESGKWVAITTGTGPRENKLSLAPGRETGHALIARMGPLNDKRAAAIPGNSSPWRFILPGDAPDLILEPDLIRDLRSGKD